MWSRTKTFVRKVLQKYNYDIIRINTGIRVPADFEEWHTRIFKDVADYTMTSPERIYCLVEAVNYIEKNNIPGDIIECGVWKGGSMVAVAETLKRSNSFYREL